MSSVHCILRGADFSTCHGRRPSVICLARHCLSCELQAQQLPHLPPPLLCVGKCDKIKLTASINAHATQQDSRETFGATLPTNWACRANEICQNASPADRHRIMLPSGGF